MLISEDKEVLYTYYGNNKVNPDQAIILKDIYKKMPHIPITYSCVTGYGEIKAGLKDVGEGRPCPL